MALPPSLKEYTTQLERLGILGRTAAEDSRLQELKSLDSFLDIIDRQNSPGRKHLLNQSMGAKVFSQDHQSVHAGACPCCGKTLD